MYAYKRVNRFNVILTLSGMPYLTSLVVFFNIVQKGEGVGGSNPCSNIAKGTTDPRVEFCLPK